MAKTQVVNKQCPIELGLNILSGKWKLKILWHISKGTVRFNDKQNRSTLNAQHGSNDSIKCRIEFPNYTRQQTQEDCRNCF